MVSVGRADPVAQEALAAVMADLAVVGRAADAEALVAVVPAAVDLEVDLAVAASAAQVVDAGDPVVVAVLEVPEGIVARAKADAEALPAAHPALAIVADAVNKVSEEQPRSQCATRLWTRNRTPLAALTSPRPIIRNYVTISAAAGL